MSSNFLTLPSELLTRIATACFHPNPQTFESLALTSYILHKICASFIPWHHEMRRRWSTVILTPKGLSLGDGLYTRGGFEGTSMEWLLRLAQLTSNDALSSQINGCSARVTAGYVHSVRNSFADVLLSTGMSNFLGLIGGDPLPANFTVSEGESPCEEQIEMLITTSTMRGDEMAVKLLQTLKHYVRYKRSTRAVLVNTYAWVEKVVSVIILRQLHNLREYHLPRGWSSVYSDLVPVEDQPLNEVWLEMLNTMKPPSASEHKPHRNLNASRPFAPYPQNVVRIFSSRDSSSILDFWPLFRLPSLKEGYIAKLAPSHDESTLLQLAKQPPQDDFTSHLTKLALRDGALTPEHLSILFSRTPRLLSLEYHHTCVETSFDCEEIFGLIAKYFAAQLVELALTMDLSRTATVSYGIDADDLRAMRKLERFEFDLRVFAWPPRKVAGKPGDDLRADVRHGDKHCTEVKDRIDQRDGLQNIVPLGKILSDTVKEVKIQSRDSSESATALRCLIWGWTDSRVARKLTVRYLPCENGPSEWESETDGTETGELDIDEQEGLRITKHATNVRPSVRSVVERSGGALYEAAVIDYLDRGNIAGLASESLGWYNEFDAMVVRLSSHRDTNRD